VHLRVDAVERGARSEAPMHPADVDQGESLASRRRDNRESGKLIAK
jgi:hypothetical protein